MGMIQEFQKADKERRADVGNIRSEVATMLKDFDKEQTECASEVTSYMRSEVGRIRSGVASMLKELGNEDKERASEIATMRSGVASMLKDFASEFSEECAKENTKRKSEVATIHEMVWGKAEEIVAPPKVISPVAELPREVPAEEAVGELRDRVFAYLANHPDGTKLVELGEGFSLARIQVAKVIRELMDDNKVEKRDLLYFAI